MLILQVLGIAVALSIDAMVVALCWSATCKHVTTKHIFQFAAAFGFFQFLMPVIGWALGLTVRGFIESWDHWIAFALLAWIGGNMIRGGGDDSEDGESCSVDPTKGRKLLILAVATSIDALAVGLSFSLLNINVWGPSTLIGVVCAVITALGLLAGKGLAHADIFGRRAELVGGCVLIGIGLKILYEHGVLS